MLIRSCLLLILVGTISGCSALSGLDSPGAGDAGWLLDGAGVPEFSALAHDLPDDDPLALTPQMERFAETAVAGHGSDFHRLRSLLDAVISPGMLGVEYEPGHTYTAAEAFEKRRVDCLSFTNLVVALARHVDMEARFNEVDVPPVWDLAGDDTLVLYKHVNAAVDAGDSRDKIVDINLEEYDTSFKQRLIRDRLAEAQYYNNRGMEFLLRGNYAESFRYLARALRLEPRVAYIWGNLGALYRRAGYERAAELAYLKALELNGTEPLAISNLARLYRETGRTELAGKLEARAQRGRLRNPYYRYHLAQDAVRSGNYASAQDELRAAIRLYEREHRFHFLMAATLYLDGETDLAARSMERALELASEPEQETRYRRKMEVLKSASLQAGT